MLRPGGTVLTLLPTPAPRLLLVEADVDVSDALLRGLRRAGWDVLHAETGSSALRLKPGFGPDLVLVSLGLPDMDGRQLVARLTRLADCAVVAMSGLGDDARRTVLDSGALDYFAKPLGMRDMLARLQAAIGRQGAVAADSADSADGACGQDPGAACAVGQRNGH